MQNHSSNLVGLMTDHISNQLVGILGILKSANGFVPIDPEYPLGRIEFIVSDCGIEILVTEAKHLNKALQISAGHHLKHIICLDGIDESIAADNGVGLYDLSDFQCDEGPKQNDQADPDRIAYVVYTSGSTGKPKGVPITHANLLPLLEWSKSYLKFGEQTRTLQSLSYCFDFGIFELLATMFFGGTLYGMEKGQRMDPARYSESVDHHAINTIHSTPSFFNELTGRGREMKTLEILHLGGEALTTGKVDEISAVTGQDCIIYNGYGPTEATVNSSIFEVGTAQSSGINESTTVPIGKASAKNALYILDRNCGLVPEGIPGELHIGGPGLAPAYVNLPDLTAQRFIPSPFSKQPGARLYKTGDLVRRLPDGNIEFLGRLDHQVKVRGFRIELGEIEAALGEHPSVREAVALALKDHLGSCRLVAYIVPDAEPGPTSSQMRGFLKQALPDYMIPSAFVMLKSMPLTPNGKLDRQALPLPSPQRLSSEGGFVAPRNASEEVVAGVCAEVLGLYEIGVDDNFFDLGCHSLLATKIVLRLREAFNFDLPLIRFFENPTVAGLAKCLDTSGPAEGYLDIPPIRLAPRDGNLPLSFAQERIRFLSELDPTSVSYHVPRALRIEGPFNVSALEQSFGELTRRHEILRTSFPLVDLKPIQAIHPHSPVEASYFDLRNLAESEREEIIHHHILEEGKRSFDLANGPLFRLSVLHLAYQKYVLILTEHHLVHDGWTQGILIRDFLALYRSISMGARPSLPELAIQYADFAYWQRQWLQGEVIDRQLSYWREQLAGAPPMLNLPTDRPRPAIQSFRGAEHVLVVKSELAESLRARSRREGVTLFMTMLAAFKTLLCRYTEQDDLVVGTGVANRRARETEGLLGMIINTLVLRTDLSGNPSYRELLKRVREVCLGAYTHQDLPFDRLVEELHPERSLDHNPLFQTMFAFQDAVTPALELPGIAMELIDAHNQSAKFDLNVVVLPHREQAVGEGDAIVTDEITVLIEYSTDLFDATTITRLASHYEALLESVARGEDVGIREINMLTEEERWQLVEEWNRTKRLYPSEKCAHELFEEQAARAPEAIAVVYQEQQLTYGELNRRANQLGRYLRHLGVGPEKIVGICLERSPNFIIAVLAVVKAGGAYLPITSECPQERLAFMLDDAGANLLLTEQCVLDRSQASDGAIYLDTEWNSIARNDSANLSNQAAPNNLAYVIYTSGSTGLPKGVAVGHSGLVNLICWHRKAYALGPSDHTTQVAGLGFDASVWELWTSLSSGASIWLPDEEMRNSPEMLKDWLVISGITETFLPTPLAEAVLAESIPEKAALRRLLTGGDRLQRRPSDRLPFELINHYGPTEFTVVATSAYITAQDGADSAPPIGGPIDNTQVYLLDKWLAEVPIGVAGEIYVGGAGLAQGYIKRPDVTAEKFIPNRFSSAAGGRLYRTGDLGRYREDGKIDFLGRIDNQVKIRGHRIEPGEIESILALHPSVRHCAVCLREDLPGSKRLVAYVVASDEAVISRAELREYMRGKLPDYMVPWAIVEMEKLPLTPNGKIDRRALPAPATAATARREQGARTPIEEVVAGTWAYMLGMEKVGIEENFFELGGHSLLAMQVVSRVREVLGVELPLRTIFEYPTVAGLAEAIGREKGGWRRADVGQITVVSRERGLPLSYAQERLWYFQQLEPESAAYNIPMTVRLKGELNVAALRQAIEEIVRRHEVLRTRYEEVEGVPVQVVEEECEQEIEIWDLRGLGEEEREEQTREVGVRQASRAMDLEEGPVWRGAIVRIGEQEQVLQLNIHHIASDGWSTRVLVKELTALYEGYREGRGVSLPALPVQYSDYAVWQREWLEGEVLQQQLTYWSNQLAGVAALQLPIDRPRSATATHRGARQDLTLSPQLSASLKAMGQSQAVTLYMILLAGFQVMLGRMTRQEDIVVGSPIAGRNREETEGLIGFFVNMLAMRTDLSGDPTVTELLGRVRQVCLGAYSHQYIPFERLAEEIQPDKEVSPNLLLQVVLALQEAPLETFIIGGLELELIKVVRPNSPFGLSLSFTDTGSHLDAMVMYNPDIYDASTIDRMMLYMQRALEWMVDHCDDRLSSLSLLSDTEAHEILSFMPDPSDASSFIDAKIGTDLDFIAPRNPVEHEIAEIWREVLGLDRVGIYDNFFELGGHSLLFTRIASRIRSSFQIDITLRELFKAPTVVGMTTAIMTKQADEEDPNELAQMLDELKQFSPEQVRELLEYET